MSTTVSLLSIMISALSHPSSSLSLPPIPLSQLYDGKMLATSDSNCTDENILYIKEIGQKRCLINQEVFVDYTCRYDVVKQLSCYCCGEIYSYIELGRICTKFCKKIDLEIQQPRVGQQPIIELPFSWGEAPDRIELEELEL